MSFSRNALRREAKKLYKEQTKGIPKKQRVPFSEFFKHYKKLKSGKTDVDIIDEVAVDEDFDFDNLVNVNEISDEDMEEEDDS